MSDVLKKLGVDGKRTLLVLDDVQPNVIKSCRNIKNLRTTMAHQLNAYDLMQSEAVIMTANSLTKVQEVFAS